MNGKEDFFISPDTTEDTFVLGVFVEDKDSGRNSELSFSLSGRDADQFYIDPLNGVVLASSEFREQISYDIEVFVSDNGEPSLASVRNFEIFLAKELSAPDFADFEREITIKEDQPVGTPIGIARARQSSVSFDIAGGNLGDKFGINNGTGEIFAKNELDFEEYDFYELWIKASFSGRPLFFTATKVTIIVTDVNDNPPSFESTLIHVNTLEAQFPPFSIAEVRAIDKDQGQNGLVTYSIEQTSANQQMFEINEESGLLTCYVELDREQVSNFKVKVLASDSGSPPLTGTATVLLHVNDVNDNAPLFSRIYSVNITENSPKGSHLVRIRTNDRDSPTNSNVTYTILHDDDWNVFEINGRTGDITVKENLDREIQEEYSLRVQADDGAWKLETAISVQVLDENDNAPVFDQSLYEFVHNINSKNIDVGRVHALDRDSPGPNSDIFYSLSHVSNFFLVQPDSGKIRIRSKLPFSRNSNSRNDDNTYKLRVLATDLGNPPKSSECEVVITAINEDEEPPVLIKQTTATALPRHLPVGTIVSSVQIEPVNRQVVYRLAGGNATSFFSIGPSSGSLTLSRTISFPPKTLLQLKISAHFQGEENVQSSVLQIFEVTSENANAPKFSSDSTRVYIREDEEIGSVIITLTALDDDEGINGKVVYKIVEGDDKHMFGIDETSGKISVAKSLDYDEVPVYNVLVQASDKSFYAKTSTTKVKIVLQDVNDNPPQFPDSDMDAYIEENAEPGTLVTQIRAFDKDSAKYAKIEYGFLEDQEEFEIDPISGIIVAKRTFDYEQESLFEITVTAKNPDADPESHLKLHIHVTGQNEYVPKFVQKAFQFAISESSPIGKPIGRVEAEDFDYGSEGEVLYFFVGTSNAAGFAIDRKSGIISVNEKLDRESKNRHVLTILAKNHGSIRGNDTDEAQVIIKIQDGNDPPVFRKENYFIRVPEDVQVDTPIVTVSAVDKDVKPINSLFSYSIAHGNDGQEFDIDIRTGEIRVVNTLDRESSPFYNLTLFAIDKGSPPATGSAKLTIEVLDINDSPPSLITTTGRVRENAAPDSFVMKLSAQDKDLAPNAEPFKYKLDSSPEANFFRLDEYTGVIRTAVVFDRETRSAYQLNVLVQDSGSPPLNSISKLIINIEDENDNPSEARNLIVIIKSFKGIFPGGKISDLLPSDPDVSGDYHCTLVDGPENIFNIENNCTVNAGRIQNGREYQVEVRANDGVHEDVAVTGKFKFLPFSQYAKDQAVVVRFSNSSEHKVLQFCNNLQSSYGTKVIDMLSMSREKDTIDALLTLKENDLVLPRIDTLLYLKQQVVAVGDFFQPENVLVDYNPCMDDPCHNDGECSVKNDLTAESTFAEYDNTFLNFPKFQLTITCKCNERFTGKRCEIQRDVCDPNPCLDSGRCVPKGRRDFHCICPPLKGGKRCEVESVNACQPSPCMNSGTCKGIKDTDFFCLCRPGYQGDRCEEVVDTCRQNPCLNGGTCVSNQTPNYRCRCLDNYYGNHCELTTMGFEELSYVSLSPLDPNANDISVIFTTTKEQALLVYNFGQVISGRSDFIALELSDGMPRFSWGGARTAVTRININRKVNNAGRWYKLTATRHNQIGTLSIEDCTESGEYCKTCNPDDEKCFKRATGEAG